MVHKLGNLKLPEKKWIIQDRLFFWTILLTLFMMKTLIYFVRHLKNAIQSFKSLSHWWPCISFYTSMSSMSLGIK